jgi:glyoxylase-like metal-dependent hydrolase (beta-lactamase superfamily II)
VIDPLRHHPPYLDVARGAGLTIEAVMDTHGHTDQLGGGLALAAQSIDTADNSSSRDQRLERCFGLEQYSELSHVAIASSPSCSTPGACDVNGYDFVVDGAVTGHLL